MPKIVKKRMVVLKKRNAEEWLEDSNLLILRGIAMQCLTYDDIAACIGISLNTLKQWRRKYPEIKDAIEIGRDEADAVILAVSFESAFKGNPDANEKWWRYRLAPKFAKEAEDGDEGDAIKIILERRNGGNYTGQPDNT